MLLEMLMSEPRAQLSLLSHSAPWVSQGSPRAVDHCGSTHRIALLDRENRFSARIVSDEGTLVFPNDKRINLGRGRVGHYGLPGPDRELGDVRSLLST